MVHYRGGNSSIDHDVYPDLDEFWADLTTPTTRRCAACTSSAAATCSSTTRAWPTSTTLPSASTSRRSAATPSTCTSSYIRNINRALAGRPDDLAVTTHLCRGNNQSMWAAEGGYDFVAEALFNDLEVDGYFLEYDDERSGTFEPLRFVPKGKMVVLGLVTTKKPALEDKDLLKRRIEEASVRRRRPAVPVAPVRVLLHRGGQQAEHRRPGGEARADRGDRRRGLGLNRVNGGARGAARSRLTSTGAPVSSDSTAASQTAAAA